MKRIVGVLQFLGWQKTIYCVCKCLKVLKEHKTNLCRIKKRSCSICGKCCDSILFSSLLIYPFNLHFRQRYKNTHSIKVAEFYLFYKQPSTVFFSQKMFFSRLYSINRYARFNNNSLGYFYDSWSLKVLIKSCFVTMKFQWMLHFLNSLKTMSLPWWDIPWQRRVSYDNWKVLSKKNTTKAERLNLTK